MGVDLGPYCAQRGQQVGFHLGRQILVRKIDQRLLKRQDAAQAIRPVVILRAQGAFQLAQGLAALRLGFRRDKVVHGLGLDQIHPAVQEGAAGELARFGGAQPGRHQRPGHPVDHRSAAVQMQFCAVLAGVGAGARKPQDQGMIQRNAGPVVQPTQPGMARRRVFAATQFGNNATRRRAAEPHHRNGGAS